VTRKPRNHWILNSPFAIIEPLFKNFEPFSNTTTPCFDDVLFNEIPEGYCIDLAKDYFTTNVKNINFKDFNNDYLVFTFFSVIMFWDSYVLENFNEPIIDNFLELRSDNREYLFSHNDQLYYYLNIFKCFREEKKCNNLMDNFTESFDIRNYLHNLSDLYKLQNYYNEFVETGIFPCEKFDALNLKLKNIDYETLSSPVIYITGQACVGKSTLLRDINKSKCHVYSRGDLGSFAGKVNNPAAVSGLYLALSYSSRYNVIGDRGFIDNPLWVHIMKATNPHHRIQDNFIDDLIQFINSSFNLFSVSELSSHDVFVILDPNNKANKQRMVNRNTNNDSLRSRIPFYNFAQVMCYWFMAKICNWNIVYVPYINGTNEIDKIVYNSRLNVIKKRCLDKMENRNNIELLKCDKVVPNYTVDSIYPSSIGIYK